MDIEMNYSIPNSLDVLFADVLSEGVMEYWIECGSNNISTSDSLNLFVENLEAQEEGFLVGEAVSQVLLQYSKYDFNVHVDATYGDSDSEHNYECTSRTKHVDAVVFSKYRDVQIPESFSLFLRDIKTNGSYHIIMTEAYEEYADAEVLDYVLRYLNEFGVFGVVSVNGDNVVLQYEVKDQKTKVMLKLTRNTEFVTNLIIKPY